MESGVVRITIRKQYNNNAFPDDERKVKKVFDYSKLRGKIKEVFGTQAKFAKAMGMSTVTLSAKLNGTVQFTAPEMNKACEVLGVSVEFIPLYFFTEKVKTS